MAVEVNTTTKIHKIVLIFLVCIQNSEFYQFYLINNFVQLLQFCCYFWDNIVLGWMIKRDRSIFNMYIFPNLDY